MSQFHQVHKLNHVRLIDINVIQSINLLLFADNCQVLERQELSSCQNPSLPVPLFFKATIGRVRMIPTQARKRTGPAAMKMWNTLLTSTVSWTNINHVPQRDVVMVVLEQPVLICTEIRHCRQKLPKHLLPGNLPSPVRHHVLGRHPSPRPNLPLPPKLPGRRPLSLRVLNGWVKRVLKRAKHLLKVVKGNPRGNRHLRREC